MTKRYLITGILTLSLTTGCATLLNSGPSSLDVAVDYPVRNVTTTVTAVATGDSHVQLTPRFRTRLDKGSDYVLTFRSPGHRDEQMIVNRSLHPAFWLNMALLAPVAALIAYAAVNPPNSLGLGYTLIMASGLTAPLGISGALIDLATNALWTHDPHQRQVRLIPAAGAP